MKAKWWQVLVWVLVLLMVAWSMTAAAVAQGDDGGTVEVTAEVVEVTPAPSDGEIIPPPSPLPVDGEGENPATDSEVGGPEVVSVVPELEAEASRQGFAAILVVVGVFGGLLLVVMVTSLVLIYRSAPAWAVASVHPVAERVIDEGTARLRAERDRIANNDYSGDDQWLPFLDALLAMSEDQRAKLRDAASARGVVVDVGARGG